MEAEATDPREQTVRPAASSGREQGDVTAKFRRTLEEVATHVDAVLDQAEREVAALHADAEAEAERYLAERRSEADRLVDDRVAQLEAATAAFAAGGERLSAHFDALSREVERIQSALTDLTPASPGAAIAPRTARPAPDGPVVFTYPRADAEESRDVGSLPRAARMVAQGSSSEQVRDALRDDYGVAEADRVIAQLFPERPFGPNPRAAEDPDGNSARIGEHVRRFPEVALLRAAQLAVGGSDRAEIERVLADEFGVAAPDEIIDELLGP